MKRLLAVAMKSALVLLVAAWMCGITTAAEQIVMKYAVTFPNNGTQGEAAQKLKELIEKHSNGRIKVEVYYSSQLGGNTESMEGLRMGTIEMTELSLTAISAYSDIWSVFALPYLWDSGKQAVEVLSSPKVMEILEDDVEANGMMIMAWQNLGARSILSTKRSINTPEDMRGLRIRVIADSTLVDSINAMGGSAIAMAWSECYSGLEQGTIDGVENSPPVIEGIRMYEVAKYFSLTEQFIMPDPILVSATWFNSLSKENQQAIIDGCKEFQKIYNEQIWPAAENASIDNLKSKGVIVTTMDKSVFVKATQSVHENFLKDASPEQKKVYDTIMAVRGK